ncbi:major facilitator superfamily domain-containing protein 6 [Penaeus vannamei]|uniref:major facilitator superfamily domain-containing protein 6 n=1 Tax=Penaeus vannamei TaxID=6689 RepID=UPI000F67AC81|nr:major facilitator superfamily domain-containing protein 6-like [Penaeus vannamei]
MACSINRPLFLHKILFFTFYGALGSIMAFLTIHMRTLGLDLAEITWINSILPLTSLAGPPIVGLLADRLGNYRVITIVFMALGAIMHTALLFVPPYEVTPVEPVLTLTCDADGAALVLDSCGQACPDLNRSHSSSFRIGGCEQVCLMSLEHNSTELLEVRAQPSAEPAYFCLTRPGGDKEYIACNESKTHLEFSRPLVTPQYHGGEEGAMCHYPQHEFNTSEGLFVSLTCRTSAPNCRVVCDASEMIEGNSLLQEPMCSVVKGNRTMTLWLYFGVRALAEMFTAILVSLLEAVALTMVHQHNGDYGREKMCGIVAVGVFSPLCGYLMDTHIGTFGVYNYAPVFYVFDGLLMITAIVTLFLPFEVEVTRKSLWKSIGSLIKTSELNILLLLMTLLGTFWGYLKTFVYVYLEDLHASKLLMGLTVTISIVPSLPFLYKSSAVVQFCGHHYLIMLAFVAYCIRFAGFSYITNPWWALLLESLELFTLNLMNVSAATLAYKLAPKTFVATAQALVWVSHFNIGRCLGTFVGGYLITQYGQVYVFQGAAVAAAIIAALYLCIHQLVKHVKANGKPLPKPQPIRENGNVPNGHYTPLQAADGRF